MYKYLESKVFTQSGKKEKRTEIEKWDSVFNMKGHLLLSE